MRFKLFFICFIAISAVIISCNDSGEGTANISSINTVDELNEFISGINFVMNLSDGKSYSFIPSNDFVTPGVTSFSTMSEGFNYSNTFNVDLDVSGRAELNLFLSSTVLISLNYGICTSIEAIKKAYPDVSINPQLDDYLVYVATTEPGFSEEEIIFGEPASTALYIQVLLDPDDPESLSGIFADNQRFFFMDGNFDLRGDVMQSTGEIYAPSGNSFFSYELKFFCSN